MKIFSIALRLKKVPININTIRKVKKFKAFWDVASA